MPTYPILHHLITKLTLITLIGLLSMKQRLVSGWINADAGSRQTSLGYVHDGSISETSEMVGQVLSGQYMIDINNPVTTTKCNIYEAYRINDP